ncbi:hypothetical protein E5345_11845 [Propionibacterium sp. NM47_B9-13]|jgi:iron complex transport system ATP-binding protein|uniref:ABC transporter domain-containing protein n=1 Tax=Cutibacterium modestum HL044PA1 TaxID=765109 RepID=A0ABN0C7R9_9ACTN|nr:hypothetical protein BCB70_12085 [Cutibacterium modestum]EFS74617.1 hypothetical protein HMPREF9621_00893 [Cutibacterium modestum HL037PA2]EFS93338.1 hypothetical protein HMPREF9607_00551 [Cutibacterium modestum HL044PA1]EFT15665.1 hypothetical protein HMPREF9622_01282 [Cutibacterium modestum HL037PA3]EGG26673.1 putative hemin import ATP-binding protein HmuV [Cutibacterium modestum P08]MCP2375524.1 hemin ABC transporter ATPase [Cutibacterium modestum 28N]MCP2379656.1 hemin ABC transporter 
MSPTYQFVRHPEDVRDSVRSTPIPLTCTIFVRVLAQTTQVVLLDELTSTLDLRHQEVIMARALRLARQGPLVLIVLHDLSFAARYNDRITVFHHGRHHVEGPSHDVLTTWR